ncbi:MAG: cytochrome P450 [Vicinamibacterales bacterium]
MRARAWIALREATARMLRFIKFPLHWPTPKNRRLTEAVAELDRMIYGVIEEYRKDERLSEKRNILSRLLQAADVETGQRMEARLIRDEAMTMMAAGHETSSNALSWTLYLLAQHPDIQEQVHDEVKSALGGLEPASEDVAKLAFCKQVIQESMRLYPPIPSVSRTPVEPDEVAGYPVMPGSILSCVTAVIHVHPEFWSEPEQFRPERFSADRAASVYPFSYLPFAAGPRECIGKNFAMLEMQLVLAMLIQRFRFRWLPEKPAEPFPTVTLRPLDGVWLKLEKR